MVLGGVVSDSEALARRSDTLWERGHDQSEKYAQA